MNLKKLTYLLLPFTLLACSSKPSFVIIAPVMTTQKSSLYGDTTAKLSISDLRTSNQVVQILREGDAAELYSSQEQLSKTIEATLIAEFSKQGLNITNDSLNEIEVVINSAKVNVDQYMMQYDAKNEISLQVKISKGDKILSKNFKTKGSSNGALTADIAVLERDFNVQLGNVLTQVVNSNDIVKFIN